MLNAPFQWQQLLCSKITNLGKAVSSLTVLFIGISFPTASSATTSVGTIGGEFAPTNSGAATYSVPLKLPAGIGGMRPDLSLVYASDSGNGLLGIGWNLSGLSSVSRCGTTLSTSNYISPVDLEKE